MIKLTQEELNEKIKLHRMWLENEDGGERLCGAYDLTGLNLNGASLDWASLDGASLKGASLKGASLKRASLDWASLKGASLDWASLDWASLDGASLDGASLKGASLKRASLDGASLKGASLKRASLDWASLKGAEHVPFVPISCPTHGEFTAWKKVAGKIIKLKIPDDAKRCSATTNKCRSDKAFVLAIENIDGTDSGLTEIVNENYAKCTYKVGELVYPDSFDENRFNECSHGIHFFVDRGEAERW